MERGVQHGYHEGGLQSVARVCAPEETHTCLTDTLGSSLEKHTREGIERGHINLLRVGPASVLCYGFEYQDPDTKEGQADIIQPIPLDFHRLVAEQRAGILVAEYFAPELRQNMQRLGVVGGVIEGTYDSQLQNPASVWHTRLTIAEMVTRFCEKSGIPVAVADIADTPLYMAERSAQVALYFAAAGWLGYFTANSQLAPLLDPLITRSISLSTSLSAAIVARAAVMEAARTPLPNPLEDLFMYAEDARRHFLAEGIKQLAAEYGSAGKRSANNGPDIIVAYPPAHLRRVINHLTDPQPWKTAKRQLYKAVQPGLHYSVRTWKYKGGVNHSSPHWEKISDRPL